MQVDPKQGDERIAVTFLKVTCFDVVDGEDPTPRPLMLKVCQGDTFFDPKSGGCNRCPGSKDKAPNGWDFEGPCFTDGDECRCPVKSSPECDETGCKEEAHYTHTEKLVPPVMECKASDDGCTVISEEYRLSDFERYATPELKCDLTFAKMPQGVRSAYFAPPVDKDAPYTLATWISNAEGDLQMPLGNNVTIAIVNSVERAGASTHVGPTVQELQESCQVKFNVMLGLDGLAVAGNEFVAASGIPRKNPPCSVPGIMEAKEELENALEELRNLSLQEVECTPQRRLSSSGKKRRLSSPSSSKKRRLSSRYAHPGRALTGRALDGHNEDAEDKPDGGDDGEDKPDDGLDKPDDGFDDGTGAEVSCSDASWKLEVDMHALMRKAFFISLKDTFVGCASLLEQWVIYGSTTITSVTDKCVENSHDVDGKWNMDWVKDPCCNWAKRAEECCAPRESSFNMSVISAVNETKIAEYAVAMQSAAAGDLATKLALQYASLEAAAATQCFPKLRDFLTSVEESWTLVDKCYQEVEGSWSSEFEQLVGPPCQADVDCWTDECAVPVSTMPTTGGSAGGGSGSQQNQKHCKTPVNTESKDFTGPMVRCLIAASPEVGEFFEFFLAKKAKELNLQEEGMALITAYVNSIPGMTQGMCKGGYYHGHEETEEACLNQEKCNWDPWADNTEHCLDPCQGGDGCPSFCGVENGFYEISQFPKCVATNHYYYGHDMQAWCEEKSAGENNRAVWDSWRWECVYPNMSYVEEKRAECEEPCTGPDGPQPKSSPVCLAVLKPETATDDTCWSLGQGWIEPHYAPGIWDQWDYSIGYPPPSYCWVREYMVLDGKPYVPPPPYGTSCLEPCEKELDSCMHNEECWEPLEDYGDSVQGVCWTIFDDFRDKFWDCVHTFECTGMECFKAQASCLETVGLASNEFFKELKCSRCEGDWTSYDERAVTCARNLEIEECKWSGEPDVSQPCSIGCVHDICHGLLQDCSAKGDLTLQQCAAQIQELNQCRQCELVRCSESCASKCLDAFPWWWEGPESECSGCTDSSSCYPGAECYGDRSCWGIPPPFGASCTRSCERELENCRYSAEEKCYEMLPGEDDGFEHGGHSLESECNEKFWYIQQQVDDCYWKKEADKGSEPSASERITWLGECSRQEGLAEECFSCNGNWNDYSVWELTLGPACLDRSQTFKGGQTVSAECEGLCVATPCPRLGPNCHGLIDDARECHWSDVMTLCKRSWADALTVVSGTEAACASCVDYTFEECYPECEDTTCIDLPEKFGDGTFAYRWSIELVRGACGGCNSEAKCNPQADCFFSDVNADAAAYDPSNPAPVWQTLITAVEACEAQQGGQRRLAGDAAKPAKLWKRGLGGKRWSAARPPVAARSRASDSFRAAHDRRVAQERLLLLTRASARRQQGKKSQLSPQPSLERRKAALRERRLQLTGEPEMVSLSCTGENCAHEQELCRAFFNRSDSLLQQRIDGVVNSSAWMQPPWEEGDDKCGMLGDLCFVSLDETKEILLEKNHSAASLQEWCFEFQNGDSPCDSCDGCHGTWVEGGSCAYCCECQPGEVGVNASFYHLQQPRDLCYRMADLFEVYKQMLEKEGKYEEHYRVMHTWIDFDAQLFGGRGGCKAHIDRHMYVPEGCWDCVPPAMNESMCPFEGMRTYSPDRHWRKGTHFTQETCEVESCYPDPLISTKEDCDKLSHCHGDCPYCEDRDYWDYESSMSRQLCQLQGIGGEMLTEEECTEACKNVGGSCEFVKNNLTGTTVCLADPPASSSSSGSISGSAPANTGSSAMSDLCREQTMTVTMPGGTAVTLKYTILKCRQLSRADCNWATESFDIMQCSIHRMSCRNREDCMTSGYCERHIDEWQMEMRGGFCVRPHESFVLDEDTDWVDDKRWTSCQELGQKLGADWAEAREYGCVLWGKDHHGGDVVVGDDGEGKDDEGKDDEGKDDEGKDDWGKDDDGKDDGADDAADGFEPDSADADSFAPPGSDGGGLPPGSDDDKGFDTVGADGDEVGPSPTPWTGGDPDGKSPAPSPPAPSPWADGPGWSPSPSAWSPAPYPWASTDEPGGSGGMDTAKLRTQCEEKFEGKWFPYSYGSSQCEVPGYAWAKKDGKFQSGTYMCCVRWFGYGESTYCEMFARDVQTPEECAACSGKWMSMFKFRFHGRWIQGEWKKSYKWMERKTKAVNVWVTGVAPWKLGTLWEGVIAQVKARHMKNFIECRMSPTFESLVGLAIQELPLPKLGEALLLPGKSSTQDFGTASVSADENTIQGDDETTISILTDAVQSNFASGDGPARRLSEGETLSDGLTASCFSVVKHNGKVVGQLVGDCIVFTPSSPLAGTVELCLQKSGEEAVPRNPAFSKAALALKSVVDGKHTFSVLSTPVTTNALKTCGRVREPGTYCPSMIYPNYLASDVVSADSGCSKMQSVEQAIKEIETELEQNGFTGSGDLLLTGEDSTGSQLADLLSLPTFGGKVEEKGGDGGADGGSDGPGGGDGGKDGGDGGQDGGDAGADGPDGGADGPDGGSSGGGGDGGGDGGDGGNPKPPPDTTPTQVVKGSMGLSFDGVSKDVVCSEEKYMTGIKETLASLTGVAASNINAACEGRRLTSLGRRLAEINVGYEITVPKGSSVVNPSSVKQAIVSANVGSMATTLKTKLQEAGVDTSALTLSVVSLPVPIIEDQGPTPTPSPTPIPEGIPDDSTPGARVTIPAITVATALLTRVLRQ